MKPRSRRLFLGVRAAALAAVLAAAAAAARASDTEVTLTRHADKTYEISGLFTVDASTDVVWSVLTDYEKIPSFVTSMRSSRIEESRSDGTKIVSQKAVGDMFFLSKTMRILLQVRRFPGSPDRLRFTDVGHQDFRTYDGDWEVRPITVGAGVSYHLLVEPGFPAPSFLMLRAMRNGARKLLDQVRAEIIRRELSR